MNVQCSIVGWLVACLMFCYGATTVAQPSHELWNGLLRQHVSVSGRVQYKLLKAEQKTLNAYIDYLAKNTPQPKWSKTEKMAYWINVYNALTVRMVLEHYPIKSIRDLNGGNPWDVDCFETGGQRYSLNKIENDILRKKFGDARVHFALNCAAKSCPPLYNRAFMANNLDAQLTDRTKRFLRDPNATVIGRERVLLNRIFEWYAADFEDIPAFLTTFSGTTVLQSAQVDYLEYDWSLNQ
jgi:hypothetical protein